MNPYESLFALIFLILCAPLIQKRIKGDSFCSNLEVCQIDIDLFSMQMRSDAQLDRKSSQHWPVTETCRDLRDSLDCLLALSPFCDRRDVLTSHPTWKLVEITESFLNEKCDRENDSFCYQSQRLKNCENLNPYPCYFDNLNCWKYLKFRNCVLNIIRTECSPLEQNLVNQYLIQKSRNMTWLCFNSSDVPTVNFDFTKPKSSNFRGSAVLTSKLKVASSSDISDRSDQEQPLLDHAHDINRDDQQAPSRSLPSHYAPNSGLLGLPMEDDYGPALAGSGYQDRLHPHPHPHPPPPQSPLPQGPGIPPPLDRPYPPISPSHGGRPGPDPFRGEICIERAKYLSRHCEDALLQSQRLANHQRTPWEVQRAICCGLLYYRDCLYRSLQLTCTNPDPYLLNLAMPISINQQLESCHASSITRVQCGALWTYNQSSSSALILGLILSIVSGKFFS
ncbi:uncharacterized protein LOC141850756 isoform X2 [Brevipalpus obovatus]|uniref:uncharacterized protein LOC141850756 isoform X2 n=1 Tax=Brevipalpus obovatus TaxID=246614 RepID=UPI003D9E3EDB